MSYLIDKYNISARYMISIHDEIRYLVKEEDAHRVALALQIGNLWTRAYFAHRVGIDDLPLVCAKTFQGRVLGLLTALFVRHLFLLTIVYLLAKNSP
jgi:hypothetical protein